MRTPLWCLLCVVVLGTASTVLFVSRDVAAEGASGATLSGGLDVPTDHDTLYKLFAKEGVTFAGIWKDAELSGCASRIECVTDVRPEEALERCDVLAQEIADAEKLKPLADDLLLAKARILYWLKRYGDARDVFRTIVEEFPDGALDLTKGHAICVPSLFARMFERCTWYLLKNPNRSADAARLGLAQCAIALKHYDEAEAILAELVPAGEKRPASEDPLVRPTGPDGYTAFYGDAFHRVSRFADLLEERPDKIALLLTARVKVLQGKTDQARDLYQTMLSLFPASGMRASYELELLNSGKMDELAESVSLHLMNPWLRTSVMRGDKVREVLKLPDQAQRIQAAKAYYADLHDGLKKEVEGMRRKRDRIRSQEVNSVE